MLLSKYAIAFLPFDDSPDSEVQITWENCTLRTWLNSDFYQSAFNTEEQSIIKQSAVTSNGFTNNGKVRETETKDSIFLLSKDEVEKLIPNDEDKLCLSTEYAYAKADDCLSMLNGCKSSEYLLITSAVPS